MKIDADDVVCIFSDGLTEARNKNETQFHRIFLSTLRSLDRRYPPSVVLDRVMQKFQEHMKGASVADDICLMILDTRKDENHEAVA
jgi:serine phosphatase RsbU (regulator of sigma subunit)